MNNLLQIREKIKKANRIYEAQLLATKNGEVTPYRRSVFEERIRKTQKEMKLKDSKNQIVNYQKKTQDSQKKKFLNLVKKKKNFKDHLVEFQK